MIDNYFEHVSNDSKKDLACEIIIELGDNGFWDTKSREEKKMVLVFQKQIKDLELVVSSFKIANAAVHLDETSPYLHIIGVPVKDKNKYGMSKQVGKSDVFTKDSLKIIIYFLRMNIELLSVHYLDLVEVKLKMLLSI